MSTISVDIDISTNAEKDMNVGGASVDTVVQPKSPAKPSTSLAVLIYAIFLIRFALVALRLHSLWPLLACIPLFVIIVTLVLGPSKTVRLFFGNRSYVPIDSPEFLQRIQDKYQPDISDLQTLGFAPLFAEGETFSVFRLLLGYPVVILLQMRSKREVISVAQGRVVIGFPIFASSDKTSYGHPSGLGIAFHTMFRDGTLLKSTN